MLAKANGEVERQNKFTLMKAEPSCRLIKTILLKRLVDFDIRTLSKRHFVEKKLFLEIFKQFYELSLRDCYSSSSEFYLFHRLLLHFKKGGDVVIVCWDSCTRARKALWEMCDYMAD